MPFIIGSVYSPRAALMPNLRDEEERMKTFHNWTSTVMTPGELAANGFYYTDFRDMARCAFCGVAIHNWEKGDHAAADHQKFSPNCDFLQDRPCKDVAKATTSTPQVPAAASQDSDTCGAYGFSGAKSNLEHSMGVKEIWSLNQTKGPRWPKLANTEIRLRTFAEWPTCSPVRPQSLAAAGFFAERFNVTYCFYCGGGLQDWAPPDDPWFEHARFYPLCAFINMVRGLDYVRRAGESGATALSVQMETMQLDEKIGEAMEEGTASASIAREVIVTCIVCLDKRRSIVFIPCGHLVTCATCASALSSCPLCRQPFDGTVRAYL